MNQIDAIYTTVSNGQVHIAADKQYIGSVDSYNNWLTQFFAWLMGKSISVNFDGKLRCLNKESYSILLTSLTNKVEDVGHHRMFRRMIVETALPQNNLRMRDVIASDDSQRLFRKLAQAISRGDTVKAKRMIGKGAELDKMYYEREGLGISFYEDTSGLFSTSRYEFKVFKGTPILQAARKGNKVVCEILRQFQANLDCLGDEYWFKREIVSVERRQEIVLDTFVRHRGHRRQVTHRPRVQEQTIVNTQDYRSSPVQNYKINSTSLQLERV